MIDFDSLVNDPRFRPYHGWHDDHRVNDRTPNYLPAIQQVRSEWLEFARQLDDHRLSGGRCLELGLGVPGGSHFLFKQMFSNVGTIECSTDAIEQYYARFSYDPSIIRGDTHDHNVYTSFDKGEKLDLLFIDAGHLYDDVAKDFTNYGHLVRKGGMIAFHDACKRPTYETEIQVWQYLDWMKTLGYEVQYIGEEVGIAYIIRTWDYI